MKKKILLILILVLTPASMSLAADDTWVRKADMPTARLGLATSIVDGKIYAIGGYAAANSPGMRTVEEYDPATDTWSRKADMPTARRWLSSSAVNGKIYAIGGYVSLGAPGLSTVEEYDPATDTWSRKADIPTARLGLSTCVVDGIIYAIGGGATTSRLLRTVEAYDPLTDTWTRKADLPTPARFFLSTCVVDEKIYAIGGSFGSPSQVVASVEEYDPTTDTWTSVTTMTEPKFALSTTTVNGKIYAIGGRSGSTSFSNVEEYDPATDTWTSKTSLPRPRTALSTSEVSGKIYAIGGSEGGGGAHPGLKTVYEYDPFPLVVDFNGDGIVDAADICLMLDYWLTDEPFYDIAPRPFGDGIVNVQDLIVLAEHLFEGAGLVAHWALDETQGDIAYDSASDIDAAVYNGQWAAGKVGGALLFNGLTTYMDCGDSLRLGTQKMTISMWLEPEHMGGMRYILSRVRERADEFDYVLMRHYEGQVEFAMAQEGSDPVSVMSNATTPLNEWTHVAVCLDGSEAKLYINGQLDASAGYGQRISCDGCRLWISSLGKSTRFYNGKIDDVRIYNIALSTEEITALAQ